MKDLMKPRCKVIADYPDSRNEVGQIICDVTTYMEAFYNKYPAIFRRLEWWEHRDVSDMPRYLKHSVGGFVLMVSEYTMLNGKVLFKGHRVGQPTSWYIPATEQEYNDYLNSKK